MARLGSHVEAPVQASKSTTMFNLPGITSRIVPVLDLNVHILENKPNDHAPLVLLLHGFPELAYSWRNIIVPLSDAGYHVVAPDQRGYGLTVPSGQPNPPKVQYGDDPRPYRMDNLAKDVVALVRALGHTSCAAVIGHDFGSQVAGFCTLFNPDMFKAVVFMSAPFTGLRSLSLPDLPTGMSFQNPILLFDYVLSQRDPPLKHYTVYYSTPEANSDMLDAPQGLRTFLREYFHAKSADNTSDMEPRPVATPLDLPDVLPRYCILLRKDTMPQSVASSLGQSSEPCKWLTEEDLDVYVEQFSRTGFQPGLNMYRGVTGGMSMLDETILSIIDEQITCPALFVAGQRDWGAHQSPGTLHLMQRELCTDMDDLVFIPKAGHWVQQEQPEALAQVLVSFLAENTWHSRFTL